MRPRAWLIASFLVVGLAASPGGPAQSPGGGGSWYFAISGDSRDCGDLIMPKIAAAIAADHTAPAVFFWHLGDFRRMYDIDCDMLLRKHPGSGCRSVGRVAADLFEMDGYLDQAWGDFIRNQIEPFGSTPVFLGIGNHELYAGRSRDDFRRTFQKWLTQEALHDQRLLDASRGIFDEEGDTTWHFVRGGVDFISLDNADTRAFTPAQILWLGRVLAGDERDDAVKAIAVGMHEALPFSTSRNHAMYASCQGRCSGQLVYDMLAREQAKKVYVFASHAHLYAESVYDTPEHRGQVLPGWIIGTAGAQQYTDTIRYGYVLVEVRPDGTLLPRFREVTKDSPPLVSGPGADKLNRFCFVFNKREGRINDEVQTPCPCGAAGP